MTSVSEFIVANGSRSDGCHCRRRRRGVLSCGSGIGHGGGIKNVRLRVGCLKRLCIRSTTSSSLAVKAFDPAREKWGEPNDWGRCETAWSARPVRLPNRKHPPLIRHRSTSDSNYMNGITRAENGPDRPRGNLAVDRMRVPVDSRSMRRGVGLQIDSASHRSQYNP